MLAVREEATRSKGEGGEGKRERRGEQREQERGQGRYSGEHCCQW